MENEHLIRTPEKKAVVDLVRCKYNTIIANLRDTETRKVEELVSAIASKLGVNLILNEIKNLDEQKEKLEASVKAMGFDTNGYGGVGELKKRWVKNDLVPDYSTAAGKMYYKLTSTRPDIKQLEEDRDNAIADVWLCTMKTEARKILDRKVVPALKSSQEMLALT